jgi:hypothetical protein
MNRAVGLALLAVGVLLIVWGLTSADSISSELSEFFQGRPSKESMWFLLGGVVLAVIGAVVSMRGTRNA